MAQDEQATIRAIEACREVIGSTAAQHGGRVVDAPGDNLLAEFPSALEAVRAALGSQEALAEQNASVPEARRMLFRMGLHLGDVVSEGDHIYGDGINIAARLEGLAEPGGVCVSEALLQQVQGKLELKTEDLGKQSIKNLGDVHVFRIREREGLSFADGNRLDLGAPSGAFEEVVKDGDEVQRQAGRDQQTRDDRDSQRHPEL